MQSEVSIYRLKDLHWEAKPACSKLLFEVDRKQNEKGFKGQLEPRVDGDWLVHRLLTEEDFEEDDVRQKAFSDKGLSVIITGGNLPFVDLLWELEHHSVRSKRQFVAVATIKASEIQNNISQLNLIVCLDPFKDDSERNSPKNHGMVVCNKNTTQLVFFQSNYFLTIPRKEKRNLAWLVSYYLKVAIEVLNRCAAPKKWAHNHSLIYSETKEWTSNCFVEELLNCVCMVYLKLCRSS